MKQQERELYPTRAVEPVILTIRGQRVILDADLARIYGVSTKALNQAVKRNAERFPSDFMFRLTLQEVTDSRSQIVTLKPTSHVGMRSQIVTASEKRNVRFLPFAFTEHRAIMAATVLNSPQAVQMSVFVVRAFIKMREYLLNRAELERKLADIEKALISHDAALRDLYQKIRPLLMPPVSPTKEVTGFRIRERHARYAIKRRRKARVAP